MTYAAFKTTRPIILLQRSQEFLLIQFASQAKCILLFHFMTYTGVNGRIFKV